eukprot:TRINITY_DN683_c0_g2_i1.p1 TRINITY_DN683_c0_g2~~TRINITY_DN683_c0_g2_i1.p1  ORF type:complete len:285 (+),score=61.42 TRINITY_DN683_c0_g2_i1:166-1020(+)
MENLIPHTLGGNSATISTPLPFPHANVNIPLNEILQSIQTAPTITESPKNKDNTKKRKTTEYQEEKRQKCDALMAFFRTYLRVDPNQIVLKDAIYNLYIRKIPSKARLARNAVYRQMWSFYKDDKIAAFQSNYRDYIKGIKLLTASDSTSIYDGYENDLEILKLLGINDLWDFREADLVSKNQTEDNAPDSTAQHEANSINLNNNNSNTTTTISANSIINNGNSLNINSSHLSRIEDDTSLQEIEQEVLLVENTVLKLLDYVQDLKEKISKRLKKDQKTQFGKK